MKIKAGFILRNVANTHIVVPVAQNTLNYKGMLSLNESGAFLWGVLQKGTDKAGLLEALLNEYEVPKDIAAADIEEFLAHVRQIGALQE